MSVATRTASGSGGGEVGGEDGGAVLPAGVFAFDASSCPRTKADLAPLDAMFTPRRPPPAVR